jgi:hypothetical protein
VFHTGALVLVDRLIVCALRPLHAPSPPITRIATNTRFAVVPRVVPRVTVAVVVRRRVASSAASSASAYRPVSRVAVARFVPRRSARFSSAPGVVARRPSSSSSRVVVPSSSLDALARVALASSPSAIAVRDSASFSACVRSMNDRRRPSQDDCIVEL